MINAITEDISSICVPIPFPLRDVNMYALRGKDGWALIDTGIGTSEARATFEDGLHELGLDLAHLQAIVLSHHHPDHIGLSGELHEQSGAPVYMHPIDEASVQIMYSGTMPERFGRVSSYLAHHGLPQTKFWYTQVDRQTTRHMISVPPHSAFITVEDGEELDLLGEKYRVIWTPGHSDGQICLFRERDALFLAADHVLPRITPNIGLYSPKERPNPLQDYLDSLLKVSHIPAQLVLPGHGKPFSGLAERCGEIIAHHEQRLARILSLLKEKPQHATSITRQLFQHRTMNDEALRMALAEVLSHLEYLRFKGKVAQHSGDEGLILYEVV